MPKKTANLKSMPTSNNISLEANSDSLAGSYISSIAIAELQSKEYKLNRPIQVRIEQYKHGFLVADDDIARFGSGHTICDAICDYQNQLIDYFRCLNEHFPKLSSKLMEDLARLNQIISKV